MPENQFVNLGSIEKVALGLGELNEEVIYIGGAVVGLYVYEPPGRSFAGLIL